MKTTEATTFEKYLNQAFEKRCKKNSSYSLRAFARDLGVSPANLSRAMNGTRGFSEKNLNQISSRLALSSRESSLLKSLCEKQFSKSKKTKQTAATKLKQAFLYQVQLNQEGFSFVSDWYHLAILALMDSHYFQSHTQWIARTLNIHEKVVVQALERLTALGAVRKENGQYISTGNMLVDPMGIPSNAVKEYHRQMLKKADEAIDLQGLDHRDFSSVVLCFDLEKMTAAKEKIKKFTEEFEAEFGPQPNSQKQGVYNLGIQFFQLNKEDLNTAIKKKTENL